MLNDMPRALYMYSHLRFTKTLGVMSYQNTHLKWDEKTRLKFNPPGHADCEVAWQRFKFWFYKAAITHFMAKTIIWNYTGYN